MKEIYIFYLLLWNGTVHAIIGYDCGTKHLNITTLYLLEIGECDIPEPQVQVGKIYMCVCFACVMDIRQCKLNNQMRFFFSRINNINAY